jgi:hypothetical protein
MWYRIQLDYSPSKDESPNLLFRKLSKSKASLFGITNKTFFRQYIKGGYYRSNIDEDGQLSFDFFFDVKDNTPPSFLEIQLRFRMRKLRGRVILFRKIGDPPPILYPKFYQPFGLEYFKKQSFQKSK